MGIFQTRFQGCRRTWRVRLGEIKPVERLTGVVKAVIHRTNDNDDKLVVAPVDKMYTEDKIRALTEFQEVFFESVIIRDVEKEKGI